MCGKSDEADPSIKIRDGTTTNTIPEGAAGYAEPNGNGDLLYGMHEGWAYYEACKYRQRNPGLYLADRNLNGRTALVTRQEPNQNRHGYECPEDKDYYPYWAWTPWKDVAVLVQNTDYCEFYQTESQNVKERWECVGADGKPIQPVTPLFEETCLQTTGNQWVKRDSWGIARPDCLLASYSRDNHLGNTVEGWASTYNWTLPDEGQEKCIKDDNCDCVLRLRYNISTSDTGSPHPGSGFITSANNSDASPIKNDQYSAQDGQEFQLAMDTTQFGRTFQDRSYVFHIKPRPSGVPPKARIFNLNVRGKRGNIVQTYPSTEYDFVPTDLKVFVGDYIHFQWTGCDTNPAGNAGEGTDQTDRSNMVQISDLGASVPATDEWLKDNDKLFEDDILRKRMAFLDQTNCKTKEELKNSNNPEQDVQNCFKLNAAKQYFDGGLIRMNVSSTFYYMSTRNNNFSNRGQKGTIQVTRVLPNGLIAVTAIGAGIFAASGAVGAGMMYAKTHPHSAVAQLFAKM